MAKVIPFKGIRYNSEKIKDLQTVVTPPYDIIDAAEQKKYYDRSPYNVIRLELGYQFPDDTEENNRYTRAAEDFQMWLQKGALTQENQEALYLYEQEFSTGTTKYRRTGFFARVQLEAFETGKILPHEETLVKPKADRLALMSACVANFSPVFGFYVDPEMVIDQEFNKIKASQTPELTLTDELNDQHNLWVLTDTKLHQKIRTALENQVLYIADGHHRYETALEFYRKMKDKYPDSGYILMYVVNACDPGMVIMPTHRVVHSLPDFELVKFKKQLEEDFLVEQIPTSQADNLSALLSEQQEAGKIAMIMGTKENSLYLLTLRDANRVQALAPGKSLAWCSLDAAVLQVMVFQNLLGLSSEKIACQENITYTRDEAEALDALNHDAQLTFLLNPTKISQIKDVALAGDKMPQKSTYFYPKLLTGLIINNIKDGQ